MDHIGPSQFLGTLIGDPIEIHGDHEVNLRGCMRNFIHIPLLRLHNIAFPEPCRSDE